MISEKKYQIETERLILNPLPLDKLEQMRGGTQCFLEQSALSDVIMLAVADKIKKMRLLPEDAHPWITYWLIAERETGRGAGLIGCKYLPDEEGYVEAGYAMAEAYRGRGYMAEALAGFLDWLYDWPFLNGVILRIQDENCASLRVAANCGFEEEGIQGGYRIFRYQFETVVSEEEL